MTAGGLRHPTSTYPHIRVEGGPRERGRQYGEQTRERIYMDAAGWFHREKEVP